MRIKLTQHQFNNLVLTEKTDIIAQASTAANASMSKNAD